MVEGRSSKGEFGSKEAAAIELLDAPRGPLFEIVPHGSSPLRNAGCPPSGSTPGPGVPLRGRGAVLFPIRRSALQPLPSFALARLRREVSPLRSLDGTPPAGRRRARLREDDGDQMVPLRSVVAGSRKVEEMKTRTCF